MLSLDGKAVEVGARAFDLLLVLVEYHGRLATKATLIERVWPRVVVDENNLPAQIASLRRILGPGAIRTVAGFGYRLEIPIAAAGTSAQSAVRTAASAEREPLRLIVPRRTWPNRLARLIGRDRDMRELQELIGRASLLTIVGTAGVSKSRIAQEILAREVDKPGSAAAWVSLQSINEVQLVPSAIALALGLSLPDGIDGFAALRHALEQVPLLLILDGVEQLGEPLATALADLVLQTQGVRAVVTSQVPLGVPWETVYRLAALPVPEDETPPDEAARYGAVELFVQRATAADRRFELTASNSALVTDICRRLDGNPLAIELAAARVPALGLGALLERLDDRFRLLRLSGRSADPRHGALHAAFDWSYSLLSAAEQRVFNRLGTFAGTFSLHAAAESRL